MKEIKITNGSAFIREFCNRKTKKAINNCLFTGVSMTTGADGKAVGNGLDFSNLEKANDLALTLMVEKLVIANVEKLNPTIEDFDDLDIKDTDLIIAEVNKLVNPVIPNA